MSNSVKVVILVVALAGAGFFFYRNLTGTPDSGVDMSEATYWVCHNEACGKDFEITLAQFAKQKNETGQVPCPHCSQMKTMRANRCPSCSRNLEFVGHGELPEVCQYCKANIGDPNWHEKKKPTAKPAGRKIGG